MQVEVHHLALNVRVRCHWRVWHLPLLREAELPLWVESENPFLQLDKI